LPAGLPFGASATTADARETAGEGAIALSARGITKAFDGKPANDRVDFTVRCGEIHALLGENGAGKTTLISVLCGQYRPDAGTVEAAGKPCRFSSPRDALRAGVGVVHQDLRQVERFTVVENVVLGTRDRVIRGAEQQVAQISRDLGFDLDPRSIVAGLTVGERQQLEIVKLLYRGMSVLILDEPTAVLAPQQSHQLFRALRQLADSGKAVVFISHRLPEVIAAADVVTVLRHGRVVAHRPLAGARPDDLAMLMVGDDAGESVVAAPGAPGEPVLALADAACGSGRRALNGMSLTVHRGEIIGIAGVSGNGQVELAEAAAGMLAPSRGTRAVHGDVVAFIPEDRLATGLVGSMSIAENLAFRRFRRTPMSTRGWLRRGKMREYARQLIERFRIPTTDDRLQVAKLSGGGLQRVIVAREMTESPDLLVAAQPTRGLDIVSARAVRAQIVQARERGAGVLLVSEDLDELMELADRILVMLGGRAVAEFGRGEATRAEIGRSMTGARREEQHEP
jgi:general nucleoside transport system ATP-binding protein